MSFWNSQLLKNAENGQLPQVETVIILDKDSINHAAIVLMLAIVICILFAHTLKAVSAKMAT